MTSVMIAVLLLQASALAQTRSVTVRGRVTPAPGPAVAAMSVLRVAVISSGYPPAVREAPVPADGSFQISNVAPGPHIVRVRAGVLPAVQDTPFPALGIFAGDTDVTGLELAGPVAVPGRVLVEGGRPLPTARMEAAPVALAANPSGTGGFAFGTPVGPDGSFVLLVTPGEYRLTSPRLPAGYVVKAMSFSGTDLQRGTLSLYQPSSSEILVTLGAPAGGVTVRGRVLGLPATGPPAGLAVAMAGVAVPVRADGTFEFLGVQPGNRDFLLRGGPTLWPSQVSSRAHCRYRPRCQRSSTSVDSLDRRVHTHRRR